MNTGTIVGCAIGLPIGGAVGLLNPALVYPEEWKKSYENNGAILFPTCGYGAVCGSLGGAIGGTISHNIIHDGGVIGGALGGAVGGTAGAAYYIYTFFIDSKKTQ
jgi:hypothetical protein